MNDDDNDVRHVDCASTYRIYLDTEWFGFHHKVYVLFEPKHRFEYILSQHFPYKTQTWYDGLSARIPKGKPLHLETNQPTKQV